MAQETNEYRENRLASLRALAEMGFTPYGHAFPHTDLKVIRAEFEEGKEVVAAGRLLMIRRMGKGLRGRGGLEGQRRPHRQLFRRARLALRGHRGGRARPPSALQRVREDRA